MAGSAIIRAIHTAAVNQLKTLIAGSAIGDVRGETAGAGDDATAAG